MFESINKISRRVRVQNADLTNVNKNEINDLRREEELLKQKSESINNLRNTKADIMVNDMAAEEKELLAKQKKMKQELKNIDIETENAEAEARRDFIRIINDNKVNQVKDDHAKGSLFLKASYDNNKTSTVTSVLGLIVPNIPDIYGYCVNNNWADLLQTVGIVFAFVFAFLKFTKSLNQQILDLPNLITKYVDFNNKKSIQFTTLIGSLGGIFAAITCSIFTNVLLWNSFDERYKMPLICIIVYSFIYDYNSIFFSFLGFIHKEQLYKAEYKNELLKKNTQNNDENTHVKNEQNTRVLKSSQSVENRKIDTIQETSKNDEKIHENNEQKIHENTRKNTRANTRIKRTGNSKITREKLEQMINENFVDGQIIKPAMVGMTGNSNFRNWLSKMDCVAKNEKGEYVKKTTSKNVVNLKE